MIENNQFAQSGEFIDDRYQVVGVIGSGAMGTVVRCVDTSLRNSAIALKFLKQDYVQDAKQFERFKNEALLMRELNHPNIVHVYDLRCVQGTSHYITMEFVEGSSLKMVMDDLPESCLPFKDAIKILREIASGMSYAHLKGIIHRDLKPDNVLVSKDGEVKLTDFGLGKTLIIAEDITDLGEAIGTPHYMSPEQLRGLKLDKRCDIYSFGIMAYELITGKKPYAETNYLKLAAKHINEPMPKINKVDIPSWFNDFIAKCCAKERDQRFQSFQEIHEVLNSFISSGKVNGMDFSKNISKRAYWIAAWQIEKWQLKKVFAFVSFVLLSIMFLVVLGKGNPTIRSVYGPFLVNLESHTKLNFLTFKNYAFNPATAVLLKKDSNSLFKAIELGNLEAIDILFKSGLTPTLRNAQGLTTLSLASSLGQVESVNRIANLMSKEEINFADSDGNTALILATKNNHIVVVKKLIKLGANINTANSKGETALRFAVTVNNPNLVETLINHGAINEPELLNIAQNNKNKEIIELLKKNSSK